MPSYTDARESCYAIKLSYIILKYTGPFDLVCNNLFLLDCNYISYFVMESMVTFMHFILNLNTLLYLPIQSSVFHALCYLMFHQEFITLVWGGLGNGL